MDKFLFKRGNQAKLPQLQTGEPFLSKDEERLYIGGNNGNIPLPNKQDMDEVTTQLADNTNKIGILNKNQISVLQYESLKVSTASGYDWQPAIQKAIDDAYANGGGVVYLPLNVEVFGIGTTPIKLRKNVSLIGSGSKNCKLKKLPGTTGNVIEFLQENTSYFFNTKYAGFTIEGTGTPKSLTPNNNSDPTNNGFVINPYWGLDGCRFEDILITDCGGTGLIIEPSPVNTSGSGAMVLQQSQFDNITVQYCGAGARIKGFVGNIQWNTCTFDNCVGNAFESQLGDNGNGPQDNTFINCAFQFSEKGFYAGSNFVNANFYGCHFEENAQYNVHFKVNANCGQVNFIGCFFARSPIHLYFEQFGGKCFIDSATYKPIATPQATDRVIKVGSIIGLVFLGFTQNQLTTISTPIEDPSFRIRGYKDLSVGTIFETDYIRVYNGISSTSTRSRNFTRREVVPAGSSTYTVTFTAPESDTNYNILLTPEFDSYCYVTNKTTNGFTINIKTPLSGSSMGIVWMLVR